MPAGTPVEQHRRRAARAGRLSGAPARGHRLPGLRRHRRADQLQRAGAPVLPARRRRSRRPAGEPASTSIGAASRATRSRRACVPSCRRSAGAYGANVKVVEVPPGPPVLSPIVAEIYGPERRGPARGRPSGARACSSRRRASSTSTTAASPLRRASCCWSTAARPRCSGVPQAGDREHAARGPGRRGDRLPARREQVPGRGDAAAAGRAARATSTRCCSSACAAPQGSSFRSASWSP